MSKVSKLAADASRRFTQIETSFAAARVHAPRTGAARLPPHCELEAPATSPTELGHLSPSPRSWHHPCPFPQSWGQLRVCPPHNGCGQELLPKLDLLRRGEKEGLDLRWRQSYVVPRTSAGVDGRSRILGKRCAEHGVARQGLGTIA